MIRAATLILALMASISLHSAAEAASCNPAPSGPACLGKPCESVGTTTLDGDQKNIIACLRDDSNNLVWKSTTGGSSGKDCVAYGQEVVAKFTSEAHPHPRPLHSYLLNNCLKGRIPQSYRLLGIDVISQSECQTIQIRDGSAFRLLGDSGTSNRTSYIYNYIASCDNGQIKLIEDLSYSITTEGPGRTDK